MDFDVWFNHLRLAVVTPPKIAPNNAVIIILITLCLDLLDPPLMYSYYPSVGFTRIYFSMYPPFRRILIILLWGLNNDILSTMYTIILCGAITRIQFQDQALDQVLGYIHLGFTIFRLN